MTPKKTHANTKFIIYSPKFNLARLLIFKQLLRWKLCKE